MARLIWLVVIAFTVSPLARAEPKENAAPRQMWLVLSPEEHFCAGPSSSWHDPSDPLLLAAGVTAKLDQHEDVRAIKLDAPIRELLKVVPEFPMTMGKIQRFVMREQAIAILRATDSWRTGGSLSHCPRKPREQRQGRGLPASLVTPRCRG